MKRLFITFILLPIFALAQQGSILPNIDLIKGTAPLIPYSVMINPNREIMLRNMQLVQQDMQGDHFLKKQQDAMKKEIMNEPMIKKEMEWRQKTRDYRASFEYLKKINPDSFSLTTAVFVTENAAYGSKFNINQFRQGVKLRADMVRNLLKKEGLPLDNDAALNYGIQQLYKRSLPTGFKDPKTGKQLFLPPMKYDFNDYFGRDDIRNVTTAKLMMTNTGQCHSLPLEYKMIAEELGAKCWLSYSPGHSYIQFMGTDGVLRNFETTCGQLVSRKAIMQSNFVTSASIRNGVYLDTLSNKRLYAQMLADLLVEYVASNDWDLLAEAIKDEALKYDPSNLPALICIENQRTREWLAEKKKVGKIPFADLPKYPALQKAEALMKAAQDQTNATGYQPMPEYAYKQWLKSIEREKQNRENIAAEQIIQKQINKLKLRKPATIIHYNNKQ